MHLLNKTRHTRLTDSVTKQSLLQKSRGLIGKKKPEAITFQTRFGIHTFGVRFGIDVLILDSKYKVVVLKKSLNPNSLFLWNPKYSTVVELPEGSIEKSKTKLGDELLFE